MLIRSQDKRRLISLNNTRELRLWECEQGFDITDCVFQIGHYSTKAKAMKVLDMIQEAYADEKLVDYTKYLQRKEIEKMDDSTILAIRNELMKKAVFQMPEDSEVEE